MSPRARAALWWLLSAGLMVTAGEAEHVRRQGGAAPGVCIASSVLLRGTGCPAPDHAGASEAMMAQERIPAEDRL